MELVGQVYSGRLEESAWGPVAGWQEVSNQEVSCCVKYLTRAFTSNKDSGTWWSLKWVSVMGALKLAVIKKKRLTIIYTATDCLGSCTCGAPACPD